MLDGSDYLPQKVLIEIGSRSLREPTDKREINSILSARFPGLSFSENTINISTVLPQRTFLEKVFSLHEEFSQTPEKVRVHRLSRHLYDLEKLMDTEHGIMALKNEDLYNNIVTHRGKFNAIRGIEYANHVPHKIRIIPPDSIIRQWEQDYQEMTQYMIYGSYLTFNKLLSRISQLQKRINEISRS